MDAVIKVLKDKRVTFFCGAGISRDSGLPTVKQTYELLSTSLASGRDAMQLREHLLSWKLPFERIMQTIIEGTGSSEFLSIYRMGKPNSVHHLIAKLALLGKVKRIITTNFDLLFERAMLQMGLRRGKDFKVYYTEDDFERAISERNECIQLIKLHGSAGYTERHQKSMRVTINTIANRLLNEKRQKIIENIFTDTEDIPIVYLGYSFSDKFDITPHIRQIKKPIVTPIIVVNHSNGSEVKLVDRLDDIPPFAGKGIDGFVVKAKTNDVLSILFHDYFLEVSAIDKDDHQVRWPSRIKRWINNKDRPFCGSYIASKLFDAFGDSAQMLKYSKESLLGLKSTNEEWTILLRIQNAFSRYRNAITKKDEDVVSQLLDEILVDVEKSEILASFQRNKLKSTVIYQKARMLETQERRDEAIRMYCRSFRIDYRMSDKLGMSRVLHQLAYNINQQKREDAQIGIKALQKSMALKLEIGYMVGLALSNHELANCYYTEGDKDELAMKHYKTAAELAEDIGELSLIPRIKTMMGMIAFRQNHHSEAIDFFHDALKLKEHGGENESLAVTSYNLSSSLFEIGNTKEGFIYFNRAKRIYKRLGRKKRIMECLTQELYLLRKGKANFEIEDLDKEIAEVENYTNEMPVYERGWYLFEYAVYLFSVKGDVANAAVSIESAEGLLRDIFFEHKEELIIWKKKIQSCLEKISK